MKLLTDYYVKDNPRMKVNPHDSIDDRELASVLMRLYGKRIKKRTKMREWRGVSEKARAYIFLYEGIVLIARSLCIISFLKFLLGLT